MRPTLICWGEQDFVFDAALYGVELVKRICEDRKEGYAKHHGASFAAALELRPPRCRRSACHVSSPDRSHHDRVHRIVLLCGSSPLVSNPCVRRLSDV